MEFVVSRNRLLEALQHTGRVIISNNDNKALRCFVFTFDGDTMTVHTANNEEWMTAKVMLDAPVVEPRPIAVWHSDMLRPVKSLEEQPLSFTVGEMQMTVRHSCGSFRLPLTDFAQEFLSYTKVCPDTEADDCHRLEYEAPVLRSVLKRCKFAMAQDELRPVMNGVYMNLTDTFADYVSSDGHKLVRVRKNPVTHNGIPFQFSLVLPSRVVNTLLRILPATGDVDFYYQPPLFEEKGKDKTKLPTRYATACVTVDDRLTLGFRPVDGRYPAYWSVIPEYHHFVELCVDRLSLIKSVDRLSFFTPPSEMLRLNISADTLRLNAEDADLEMYGEESLPCVCKANDGKPMSPLAAIGMKCGSLSQTLKSLTSEKVCVRIISPSTAIIIQPAPQPDTEELTMLLMPMLCDD